MFNLATLRDYFVCEPTVFKNGEESVNSTLTYCKDINEFTEMVINGRNLQDPTVIVGCDGGMQQIVLIINWYSSSSILPICNFCIVFSV